MLVMIGDARRCLQIKLLKIYSTSEGGFPEVAAEGNIKTGGCKCWCRCKCGCGWSGARPETPWIVKLLQGRDSKTVVYVPLILSFWKALDYPNSITREPKPVVLRVQVPYSLYVMSPSRG